MTKKLLQRISSTLLKTQSSVKKPRMKYTKKEEKQEKNLLKKAFRFPKILASFDLTSVNLWLKKGTLLVLEILQLFLQTVWFTIP